MFRSDFSKYEICSESFTKTLYGMFLVSECIFKLFCHCESLRWWQICYACIAEKSLNRLLLLLILKSSNHRWSVKQGALKNFANLVGNHLCWSLLIIRSPEGLQRSSKRLSHRYIAVKFTKFLRVPILKSICEPLHVSS